MLSPGNHTAELGTPGTRTFVLCSHHSLGECEPGRFEHREQTDWPERTHGPSEAHGTGATCTTRHFITETALRAKMFYGCSYKIQFKLQFILSSSLQIDDRHFQLTPRPWETLVHFAASFLPQGLCAAALTLLCWGCGCCRDPRPTVFVSHIPPQPRLSTPGPAAAPCFSALRAPRTAHLSSSCRRRCCRLSLVLSLGR